MKKALPGDTYTLFILIILLYFFAGTFNRSYSQSIGKNRIETEITFPVSIHDPYVGFNLQLIGSKQFKVVLDEKHPTITNIKIFDILGNLILEDKFRPEDGTQKSYNFSHINSNLFVVEVGNSKYNRTKSIYASPQGSKKEGAATERK